MSNRGLRWLLLAASLGTTSSALGQTMQTGTGKIIAAQGHANPACRVVIHKDNQTNEQRWFRVPVVTAGKDDINAVALVALATQRNAIIAWTPNQTTGCGSEPAIIWIQIQTE
jgi:hypothetical protein